MLIAQISDTHILAPESDHESGELRADCLRRCVADINRLQPDVVIFTGDTVQHGQAEEYRFLHDLLEPLTPPLFMIPGNRDDNDELRAEFAEQDHFPVSGDFLHYVIEDFPLRLVAIDSTLRGERKGVFCAARQEWLQAVLSDQQDRPTLLFIHHPPFDVGDHYVGGYRRAEEATALADLVARHSQVEGLLCGHVHWPVEERWAGTEARIMPSVAVDLRNGFDESAMAGDPVYMLHRVKGGQGITSEQRRVSS